MHQVGWKNRTRYTPGCSPYTQRSAGTAWAILASQESTVNVRFGCLTQTLNPGELPAGAWSKSTTVLEYVPISRPRMATARTHTVRPPQRLCRGVKPACSCGTE